MLKMHDRLTDETSACVMWLLMSRMVESEFRSKWKVSEICHENQFIVLCATTVDKKTKYKSLFQAIRHIQCIM